MYTTHFHQPEYCLPKLKYLTQYDFTVKNKTSQLSWDDKFMKFLRDNTKFSIILIIAGAIITIAVFELSRISKILEEISNNTTIIVEITVGLVIAFVVYGVTKKWQDETETTLDETRNIAKSLAEMTFKNEIRITQTNIKYLKALEGCNEELSMFYEDCVQMGVGEPILVKELKKLYKTCIQLWEMYDGSEDSRVILTDAVNKIKPKSMFLDDDELLKDLGMVIDEQEETISRCMEMEVKDLEELKKSKQPTRPFTT